FRKSSSVETGLINDFLVYTIDKELYSQRCFKGFFVSCEMDVEQSEQGHCRKSSELLLS
ncbi:hypothetical protein BgiBS90_010059, partial [Biomphalaria glabrata]